MTIGRIGCRQPKLHQQLMVGSLTSLSNYRPNLKRQAVIFHSDLRVGELAASSYHDTLETIARFTEFGISYSVISDPSILKRIIQNDNKPITLVLTGGYTPLTARVLKEVYPAIQQRTQTRQDNTLNIWGQCAGGNILCQELNDCRIPVETAKIVPLHASAHVFPIEPRDPKCGDARNRRVIDVTLPYFSETHTPCKVFWYRGSTFKNSHQRSRFTTTPLAFYDQERVAESLCLHRDSGSAIVVSGIHPEVVNMRDEIRVPGHPNAETILESDIQRQLHVQYILRCLDMVHPIQASFNNHDRTSSFLFRSRHNRGALHSTAQATTQSILLHA